VASAISVTFSLPFLFTFTTPCHPTNSLNSPLHFVHQLKVKHETSKQRVATRAEMALVGLLHCYVWSVLLYGCETWTISKVMKDRLMAVEVWLVVPAEDAKDIMDGEEKQ